MDELSLRFPHVFQQIVDNLEDKSITNCREVSSLWYFSIDNQRTPWIRGIKKYIQCSNPMQKLWKKVLYRTRVATVKELACAVHEYYTKPPNRNISKKKCDRLTPLHFAGMTGNLDIFLKVIGKVKKINPKNIDGQTPLHMAAKNGHISVCKFIIKNVKNKNPKCKKGLPPLHQSAENGHLDLCQLIMNNVDDKNPKDEFGITPLH